MDRKVRGGGRRCGGRGAGSPTGELLLAGGAVEAGPGLSRGCAGVPMHAAGRAAGGSGRHTLPCWCWVSLFVI